MPFVSASATRIALAENGWTTFHRMLADDGFQGPGVADFMQRGLGASKVAVHRRRVRVRQGPGRRRC